MRPVFVPFILVDHLRGPNETSFAFGDFQYDFISDAEIQAELATCSVLGLEDPWDENTNHAARIAALVKLLSGGYELEPVEMELSEYNHNLNKLNDGHHRIRALQFVKASGFWASLGGYEDLIDEFTALCKRYS